MGELGPYHGEVCSWPNRVQEPLWPIPGIGDTQTFKDSILKESQNPWNPKFSLIRSVIVLVECASNRASLLGVFLPGASLNELVGLPVFGKPTQVFGLGVNFSVERPQWACGDSGHGFVSFDGACCSAAKRFYQRPLNRGAR